MPVSSRATHRATIIIDGSSSLPNELLAYALEREFNVPCLITSDIELSEIALPDATSPVLLLIDCLTRHASLRLPEFEHTFSGCSNPLNVALFNISSSLGIERETFPEGIKGYFYRHDTLEVFIRGVQALLLGHVWISGEVLANLINGWHPAKPANSDLPNGLSKREKEILLHMAIGADSCEIARKLYISRYTVKTHLYHIYKKVGVSNRLQAALWAERNLMEK